MNVRDIFNIKKNKKFQPGRSLFKERVKDNYFNKYPMDRIKKEFLHMGSKRNQELRYLDINGIADFCSLKKDYLNTNNFLYACLKETSDLDSNYTGNNFKLRPRLTKFRNSITIMHKFFKEIGEERRTIMTHKSPYIDDNIYPSQAVENNGAYNQSMETANPTSIHHFTDEYYLSCLTSEYKFSLTHNDLISVEKDSIPGMLKNMNDYLISIDPKLELEHIGNIDHDIYRNDYLLFSFSKVFVENYFHYTTNKTKCYITEFVAFSKYPRDKFLVNLITGISKIIYEELRKQDIYANIRLIDMSKNPTSELEITRLFVIDDREHKVQAENINVRDFNMDKSFYPYLEVDLLLSEFSISNDKLLILYGNTGSGKTKLSSKVGEHLVEQDYKLFITTGGDLLKGDVIGQFTRMATNKRDEKEFDKICLIIDDIDPKLLNRKTDKGVFNSLITIIDGNLDMKIKVIITTNHILEEESDAPLYRSGRLFDSIFIRYLTRVEARDLLKLKNIQESKINTFLEKHKDKEIKQADVAQFIYDSENKITKSYYKGDTKSRNKVKSVGFIS